MALRYKVMKSVTGYTNQLWSTVITFEVNFQRSHLINSVNSEVYIRKSL